MLREQDRFLPIANIAKIMKRAIPENGKIAKDARGMIPMIFSFHCWIFINNQKSFWNLFRLLECVQECVSEFISFITSEASERCCNEKRKTMNGEDILWAMTTLGFDNYIEPLKVFLQKYRESSKTDRNLEASGDEQQHEDGVQYWNGNVNGSSNT